MAGRARRVRLGHGTAGRGIARHGRQGKARCGKAWLVEAGLGLAGMVGLVGRGSAWMGTDGYGKAGGVWRGQAGPGEVRSGMAGCGRRVGASCVVDRLGGVRNGELVNRQGRHVVVSCVKFRLRKLR